MEKNINELLGMCFDCGSTDCALNNNGECRFPLVSHWCTSVCLSSPRMMAALRASST